MTLRRATLYIGGGSLLVAWFSSAASVSLRRTPSRAFSEGQSVAAPTDGVAEAVQAQSRRLRSDWQRRPCHSSPCVTRSRSGLRPRHPPRASAPPPLSPRRWNR